MLKSTNIKLFIKKWYESITKNHFETIMSSNLEYFLKHGKSFLPDVSFAQYFEEFKDYCTKTDNNALEKAYKMVKNLTTLRRSAGAGQVQGPHQGRRAGQAEGGRQGARGGAGESGGSVNRREGGGQVGRGLRQEGAGGRGAAGRRDGRRGDGARRQPQHRRRRSERRRRQWQPTHLHDRAGPQPTAARRRPKTPALLGPVGSPQRPP